MTFHESAFTELGSEINHSDKLTSCTQVVADRRADRLARALAVGRTDQVPSLPIHSHGRSVPASPGCCKFGAKSLCCSAHFRIRVSRSGGTTPGRITTPPKSVCLRCIQTPTL